MSQSKIVRDYEVASPNIHREIYVPKRYAQIPIVRMEKPEPIEPNQTTFSMMEAGKQAYSPIKQGNSYSLRESSPLRGPAQNESRGTPVHIVQQQNSANQMRTQPTKVELGLEHGNTYQQASRARPFEYTSSFTQGNGSIAYPFNPDASKKPTIE